MKKTLLQTVSVPLVGGWACALSNISLHEGEVNPNFAELSSKALKVKAAGIMNHGEVELWSVKSDSDIGFYAIEAMLSLNEAMMFSTVMVEHVVWLVNESVLLPTLSSLRPSKVFALVEEYGHMYIFSIVDQQHGMRKYHVHDLGGHTSICSSV